MAVKINVGAYGDGRSAAAAEGAKDAVAGATADYEKGQEKKIAREEREYVTGERERVAAERIYNREEDFYIANEVTDAGLGFTDEIQSLLMKKKAKYGKIAGLGYKATDEQRAELRAFSANVQSISGAQEYLKTTIGEYKTELAENGGVSTGMDADIAALWSDLSTGKGDFKPVEGENGEIRFEGTTSLGCGADGKPSDTDMTQPCNINYSYDQLKTLTFSPKYDLNKSLKADGDLLGSKENEILLRTGGSYTDKNTSDLLLPAATQLAESTIIPTKLNEIAAELGYPAGKRRARVKEIGKEAFREEIVEAYAQRLISQKDSSRSYQGNLSADAKYKIDNPSAPAGRNKYREDEKASFRSTIGSIRALFQPGTDIYSPAGVKKLQDLLPNELKGGITWIEAEGDTPGYIGYKSKLETGYTKFVPGDVNDAIQRFAAVAKIPQLFIGEAVGTKPGGWRNRAQPKTP